MFVSVEASGLNYIDSLLWLIKWNQKSGEKAIIPYRFLNQKEDWRLPLTDESHKNLVRDALATWEAVANILFVETPVAMLSLC